ncbi:cation:proton antiporter, partial [Ottowia sp.]|uniref:cation:proton antiporter n=1 Tax=Ottowia sp. TaxID=1898956 RepID=UPI0039E3955D
MQQTVLSLLAVMALVGLSGWLAQALPRIPLALLQIALGAAAGWPAGGLQVRFHPEVFMLLFIPPMLFADGWQMPQREFGTYKWPILLLSTVFVFFNVWVIGNLIHLLIGSLPRTVCFLLAAVLSPTDPVAVSALLQRHPVPPKLRHILEGESLMNDAAALIAVKFAVAAVVTRAFSLPQALGAFVWTAAGGVAVGVACSLCLKLAHDRLWPEGGADGSPAVLLMLLAPFAPYLVAEHFGLSGVLAVVAGGMAANALQVRSGRFRAFRLQAQGAWATLLFALHGLVFTLVGLQLPALLRGLPRPLHGAHEGSPRALLILLGTAAAITLALVLLRFATLLACGWLARSRRRAPRPSGAARPWLAA